MRVLLVTSLLVLVAPVFQASPLQKTLISELRELLDTISKKDDVPDDATVETKLQEVLISSFPDDLDTPMKDLDRETLTKLEGAIFVLLQETTHKKGEAEGIDLQASVVGRLAEGYLDRLVYTSKNTMMDLAGDVMDSAESGDLEKALAKHVKAQFRVGGCNRNAQYDKYLELNDLAGSGSGDIPYVFSPFDAVSIYVVAPFDALVSDMYRIVQEPGDSYLGSYYYDLAEAVDKGLMDLPLMEAAAGLLQLGLPYYTVLPAVAPAEDMLDELADAVMDFGRFQQGIDAKDPPPVKGLDAEGEAVLAKVFKTFKPTTKALSHKIRSLAKHIKKGNYIGNRPELQEYAVDILLGEA